VPESEQTPEPLPRVAEGVLDAQTKERAERTEVVFEPGPTVLARLGDSLLRVAQANQVPLESGCRMGLCGADPVRILSGHDNVSPPTAGERATLKRLGLPEGCRMACTARVRGPLTVAPGLDVEREHQPVVVTLSPVSGPLARRPPDVQRVIIIGNGVAGVTAAVELKELCPELAVSVLADEPYDFYNRMIINQVVTEELAIRQLYLMPGDWAETRRIQYHRGVAASWIDTHHQEVVTRSGEALPYDRLILASGARPFVPDIDGLNLAGSFVMRTIDDAVQLQQHIRRRRCRTAVVIGGGLLGLETAYSMTQLGVRVFVLDIASWPLSRQLDRPAGALVWQMMSDLGIKILPQVEARRVLGTEWVEAVELSNGHTLSADVCLVAAGIRPNVALAQSAGLLVRRGVVVDEHMRTSNPRIFAAGDVAEYADCTFGLWPAATEQARAAVQNLLGNDYSYAGTAPPTRLKVAGIDLLSAGEIAVREPGGRELRVQDGDGRQYRRLVLSDGRIRGAILIGHADLAEPVAAAVDAGLDVSHALARLGAGDWSALAA
jgi:NAD(P)H-nitrite reductase large subunit/ferredoxin